MPDAETEHFWNGSPFGHKILRSFAILVKVSFEAFDVRNYLWFVVVFSGESNKG